MVVLAAGILAGNRASATVGATTPFISYEGENGLPGGGAAIVALTAAPTDPYSSPQLEASGHAFIELTNTGQSVTWTNNTGQNITAINLRSCIPDAPTGGGITSTIDLYVNGTFRQAFPVNSLQNYCYEGTNYNGQADKNPMDGNPRGFWNDTHAFITNGPVTPGSTLTFQKDAANSAAFYYIDVVDLEAPPPPLTQPANSLSILSYNAVSNNPSVDNTAAFSSCFAAAQSQGMSVWIPPGTYYISAINGGLNPSGITIEGAGPWYSTIYRMTPNNNNQGVANIINAVSCTLENVSLDCNSVSRAGNNNNGAVDFSGNNWVVNNVWIQHVTSSFWCAGMNGIAENCRTLTTWADGGNFNNVQSANRIGMNLTYSNNFVRGTGDDAMAINSVGKNVFGNNTYYYTTMSNIVYVNNTAIGAWGGKGIGIYGGINDLVTNNLLCDTARYIGLGVGRFGVNGSDLLSAKVMGNVVLRCGGNGYSQQQQALMIGNGGDGQNAGSVINVYCASNTVIDAMYGGASFTASSNIVFQYNTIISPGQAGIIAGPPFGGSTSGNAIVYSNTVTGLKAEQPALTNMAGPSYAVIRPVTAADYLNASGVTTEPCAEGGQDLTGIQAGDWSAYNGIMLSNANTFVARVASVGNGGNIEVHLDSPTGTLLAICAVPGTGGAQTYVNAYANIVATNGNHGIYLVYTGGSGSLFNVEYFSFFVAPPVLSQQLIPGNTYALNAVANGLYVTAPNNGSNALIAQSATVGVPQEFQVVDQGGGNISLLALVNSLYVCADNDGASPLIANRTGAGSWETYTEYAASNGNIALRAMNNGQFVTAENGGASPLIADSSSIGPWQSFTVDFVAGAAPAAPADVTTMAGNKQVALNWLPSPGATGYNVGYATANGGPYKLIATNILGTSFLNTGLTNGTIYYYVVTATNAAGASANSAQVIAIPGTLDRTYWVATSSTSGGDSPGNALDGDLTTRWSTDTSQVNGQWFEVDMGVANTFTQMVLNCVNSGNDYPRGYKVYVSNDGINWGNAIATGTGTPNITTNSFPAQAARFVRIQQTGSTSGTFWSIDEFNLLGTLPTVPATPSVTTVSTTTASLAWNASVSATGYNVKRSTVNGSGYVTVAGNVGGLSFFDSGLTPGTTYYYVVTATNSYGESQPSSSVAAHTVPTTPTQLTLAAGGGQMQLNWASDHTGWILEVQTNGLGTNWVAVANSSSTNQMAVPIDVGNGAVFFRLVSP